MKCYPGLCWHKDRSDKSIYITFDDGPIPEVTPFVLDELDKYQAKATFFCVGDNVRKYPQEFARLQQRGHRVGNHTFNHLNGWKTDLSTYDDNVAACNQVMSANTIAGEGGLRPLFRPPYGKISRQQIRRLRPAYDIVMWDVLTGDFDANLAPDQCLETSIRTTKNGSIVIFHDSLKAQKNLSYVLPRLLRHFAEKGFRFPTL